MKRRFPALVYNTMSIVGAVIAALTAGLILFLIVIDILAAEQNAYVGILTFIVLPAILIFGLLLIALGIFRTWRKKKAGKLIEQKFPIVDFNNSKQRNAFIFFSVTTVILMVFSAFGSFKAYEYTESDAFCGTTCHTVMEPEYTAYQNSPHQRVGCAKCHIGSGADWYVKSKISGSYQLYSVTFNKYSRPIATPIENLRPAQQTCEQCHFPQHFYGKKEFSRKYFLSDEKNTQSSISMLLKIGGGDNMTNAAHGIHWHVSKLNTVYYYAPERTRQQIPYIKVIDQKGNVTEYMQKGFDVRSIKPEEMRTMDCIDCHNRPSHIYNEPHKMVDLQLTNGKIDSTLPYIKSIAVKALEGDYKTKQDANQQIEFSIRNFYNSLSDFDMNRYSAAITQSIATVKHIYSISYFPEMKVSWRKYPNNIGHMYYEGCFRCHDGRHQSPQGRVISANCNNCHTIIEQVSPEYGRQFSMDGMQYYHPGNLTKNIGDQKCTDCHGVNN